MDEASLKHVAEITGGQYFHATDPHSLHKIYQTINTLETVQQDASTVRPQKEYYPWILGLVCVTWFFWSLLQMGLLTFLSKKAVGDGVVNGS